MSRRENAVRAALTLALLAATAGGCANPQNDAEGTGMDFETIETMQVTREDARSRLQQIAHAVEGAGLSPVHASGRWATCSDDGVEWQYEATAQLGADGPSTGVFDQVVEAVTDLTGWSPDVTAQSTRSTARGTWEEVAVTVHAYDDVPSIALRVAGPCLPVAPEDRSALDEGDPGSQELDIGAPAPS